MNTKIEAAVLILTLTILGIFLIHRNRRGMTTFFLSLLGVFLFELIFDPLVRNDHFHSWTYVFHDVCFILTLGWGCLITMSKGIVDFTFPKAGPVKKFLLTLCVIDALAVPAEVFLVYHGFRTYSASLIKSMPFYQNVLTYDQGIIPAKYWIIPPEFIISIPFLFALILSFVKYWENVMADSRDQTKKILWTEYEQ